MMAKNPARGSGRIVGGQEAVPNSYPHLVFLLIDSLYVCGGNIFNENTIITAAHCADGANRIQITAGAHDQTQNEPSQQVVISTSHIEHPRLIAQRLMAYVRLVGADAVIACTDCGFSTAAGATNVPTEIVWAKIASMVSGAALVDEMIIAEKIAKEVTSAAMNGKEPESPETETEVEALPESKKKRRKA